MDSNLKNEGDNFDIRIRDLEAKIDSTMKELEDIKKESVSSAYHFTKVGLGITMIIGAFILFIKGTLDVNLLLSVMAILIIFMGTGLLVLGKSENNDGLVDSINIYIGKQLFEKGLYGFVIGVVVGSVSFYFDLLSQ